MGRGQGGTCNIGVCQQLFEAPFMCNDAYEHRILVILQCVGVHRDSMLVIR
jgi:hypothetical protein